jgi:hypothetical protein
MVDLPSGGLEFNLGQPEIEDFERSAIALTLLACPTDSEAEERRGAIHTWLCGRAINLITAREPEWVHTRRRLVPAYVSSAATQTGENFGPIGRVYRDRMVAAKMAIPFLIEAETGQWPPLPEGVRHFSINEMAEFCAADAGQSDASNVKIRIWKPSRPIIHFACAVAVALDDRDRAGVARFTFDDMLLDWSLTRSLVERAQEYALLVPRTKLNIGASELIRMRLP